MVKEITACVRPRDLPTPECRSPQSIPFVHARRWSRPRRDKPETPHDTRHGQLPRQSHPTGLPAEKRLHFALAPSGLTRHSPSALSQLPLLLAGRDMCAQGGDPQDERGPRSTACGVPSTTDWTRREEAPHPTGHQRHARVDWHAQARELMRLLSADAFEELRLLPWEPEASLDDLDHGLRHRLRALAT